MKALAPRLSPFIVLTLVLASALVSTRARADGDPPVPAPPPAAAAEEDATVVEARREFMQGAELVKAERWAEALAAFERADKLKTHAITTYDIAQCERAMGQYTRARRGFLAALDQDAKANGAELPENVRVETRGLVAQIDRILPRVEVKLRPADAQVAVDGRPLERASDEVSAGARGPVFVAGTLPPGPGAAPGVDSFVVVTDPGAHVITVSRRGYQDVVVNRTFPPGTTSSVGLELDRLPASIHVTSNLGDAIVRVNDADVGNPPVDVSRNAGRYEVKVTRQGFVPYEADFAVRPGERVELAANLREEKRVLTQRWWFWTGAAVLVIGAAVGTYFATRSDPEPQRPPTDGGGLGWSLKVP